MSSEDRIVVTRTVTRLLHEEHGLADQHEGRGWTSNEVPVTQGRAKSRRKDMRSGLRHKRNIGATTVRNQQAFRVLRRGNAMTVLEIFFELLRGDANPS